MDLIRIEPTKSNLIRLREERALAKDGYDLLDQKKDILIGQIDFLAARADRLRREVNALLKEAYGHLREALLANGEAAVEAAGLGLRARERILVRERSLMGVILPLVQLEIPPLSVGYGLQGTGEAMDATAGAVDRAMGIAAELAEVEVGLARLFVELKRTLKRMNVLAYVYLPAYRASIKNMEEILEEKERESLFKMKRLKRLRGSGLWAGPGGEGGSTF